MDRRTFVWGCAAGLVAAGAGAQTTKPFRVGFLSYATPEQAAPLLREFTEGLRDLGYVDNRVIVVETIFGDDTQDRLPELAAAMVRTRVDAIVTGANTSTAAAKRATSTIPIVMVGTVNPVGSGFVASLARPGGNVTGLCIDASADMTGKNLALLSEIVPGLKRVGVLRHAGFDIADLRAFAERLNLELVVVDVSKIDELDSAFATLRRRQVGAVVVRGSLFYIGRRRLADLALEHRLPATHALKEYAAAGVLMTYGANLADLYRRAASYVDRIAKGAQPTDLPVEQPVKFELVINMKTARALGIAIPPAVLLRADEVIR